jgi:RND superfamily putative drug exporter
VAAITHAIGATAGVVSVSAARFDPAGDVAVFSAVPATAPTDVKTSDLVHTIRAERPRLTSATGATFMVGGATAINIDSAQKVQDSLLPYLAVVVSLAFGLLLVVFRSVLVPLKAALGFLLSVLAALGAVVAVFQWGWLAGLLGVHQTGPIMSLMPIFMGASSSAWPWTTRSSWSRACGRRTPVASSQARQSSRGSATAPGWWWWRPR